MNTELILLIAAIPFYGGLWALYYFIKSHVKATVEKSIEYQFDLKLKMFEQDFIEKLHNIDRKDKFRLVALEKRFEAHQKALALSIDMIEYLESSDSIRRDLEKRISEYWSSSCLYLANDIRMEFKKCWDKFVKYSWLMEQYKNNQSTVNLELDKIEERLKALPAIIAKGVDLEAMTEESFVVIKKNDIEKTGI